MYRLTFKSSDQVWLAGLTKVFGYHLSLQKLVSADDNEPFNLVACSRVAGVGLRAILPTRLDQV